MVTLLLEKGDNVDSENDFGAIALMLAVGMDNIEIVKLLLERGANVNEKNNNGEIVLMYLANNGRIEVKSLNNFHDIGIKSNYNCTAIDRTKNEKNYEIFFSVFKKVAISGIENEEALQT